MKKTVTLDDDVLEAIDRLPHNERRSLGAFLSRSARDTLDDLEAFKRREKARERREAKAQEQVPA